MDAVQAASDLTLSVLVVGAIVSDFLYMKISNRLIFLGLGIAPAFRLMGEGMAGIVHYLMNIILPVLLLYFIYLLGVMGAGDIKLFSVIGGFVNFKELVFCMCISFAIGAVFSMGKLLKNRNWEVSLFAGAEYFKDLLRGKRYTYDRNRMGKKNLIHFSLAIGISLLLVKGGM